MGFRSHPVQPPCLCICPACASCNIPHWAFGCKQVQGSVRHIYGPCATLVQRTNRCSPSVQKKQDSQHKLGVSISYQGIFFIRGGDNYMIGLRPFVLQVLGALPGAKYGKPMQETCDSDLYFSESFEEWDFMFGDRGGISSSSPQLIMMKLAFLVPDSPMEHSWGKSVLWRILVSQPTWDSWPRGTRPVHKFSLFCWRLESTSCIWWGSWHNRNLFLHLWQNKNRLQKCFVVVVCTLYSL